MEYALSAGIPLAFVALFAVCVYLIRRQPLRQRPHRRDPRQALHREHVSGMLVWRALNQFKLNWVTINAIQPMVLDTCDCFMH